MNKIQIIKLKSKKVTDFAKERNVLLKKAKSEWVLFLDSDETLSNGLKKEIADLEPSDYNGFYVKRDNYFLRRYIGSDRILRLGRKDSGMWSRRVHEVWNINGKIGDLRNPIIHNSYKNLHEAIEKINYYSTLHAKANREEGKRANILKIVFFPKLKFVQSILRGRGVVFSIMQAFHSFLSWSKLYFSHS